MNDNGFVVDRQSDLDLDALMRRVREAAGLEEEAPPPVPTEFRDHDQESASPPGFNQVVAAQSAWNERTTKLLAAIVDCIQSLHDSTTELDSRMSAAAARALTPSDGRRRQRAETGRLHGRGKRRNGRKARKNGRRT